MNNPLEDHLRNIEWFKSEYKYKSSIDLFSGLVRPGIIDTDKVKDFLLDIPYEKFGSFVYFKAIVRQNTYSSEDLKNIAGIVSQVATICYFDINKTFAGRVRASHKEEAFHSHVRASNCWQLLKNAVCDPVKLELSGTDKSRDDAYSVFTIENEEFEEINHRNLG